MLRIVFDLWGSDRSLPRKFFPGAGDLRDYTVDSGHTTTLLTSRDERGGYVFVGTPKRRPDFIEEMHRLKKDFVDRGYRASPEVVDFDDEVAGFSWAAPGGRK